MFLFPRLPKPLRLRTAKMEMTVKISWKGPVQRHHPLLRRLKILSLTRRENMLKYFLLPAPLPLRLAGETSVPEDGGELFDFMDS
jgi:hypothetical protein